MNINFNIIKKIVKYLIIIISIIFLYVFFTLFGLLPRETAPRLYYVKVLIGGYISQNNGKFPESIRQLEKSGYVKESEKEGKYYYKTDKEQEDWFGRIPLDNFQISFGISANSLKKRDGKLFDESTGEEVMLISGPANQQLKKRYNEVSLYWYDLMIQYQSKTNEDN